MTPVCPVHHLTMSRYHTKYGPRFECPADGCDWYCWGGATSTPCNKELATLRHQCHEAFDPIWKREVDHRTKARARAYAWLATLLGKTRREAHIGMCNADECRLILERVGEVKL